MSIWRTERLRFLPKENKKNTTGLQNLKVLQPPKRNILMKAVLQRVKNAEVTVDGESVGKIGEGYMLLLGVMNGDTKEDAELLAKKTAMLRVHRRKR